MITGAGERVVDHGFDHIFVEFADDIDDFGIPDIADVFLDRLADPDQLFNGIFGDKLAHVIVDTAPGKNDFGVVTHLFGLVGEIVGVDADAVPADQAGEKLEF